MGKTMPQLTFCLSKPSLISRERNGLKGYPANYMGPKNAAKISPHSRLYTRNLSEVGEHRKGKAGREGEEGRLGEEERRET